MPMKKLPHPGDSIRNGVLTTQGEAPANLPCRRRRHLHRQDRLHERGGHVEHLRGGRPQLPASG